MTPLVVCFGAIGDLVRLTAPLRGLARRWGRACDVVADHPAASEVFRDLDSVGAVRLFTTRRWPFAITPQQWRLLPFLAQHRSGPVYVYEQRRHRWAPWKDETRIEALLRRAGVPRRRVVTLEDCPRAAVEHTLHHWLRVAHRTPADLAPAVAATPTTDVAPLLPELALSPAEKEGARDWLRARGWRGEPVVAFQTTTRRKTRGRWPAERWSALARAILAEEPSARVVLLGTAADRAHLDELRRICGQPRVELGLGLGLRPLFGVLSQMSALISLDTGPAHAAAALGCPVVVIAGRADPRRHRPVGRAAVRVVTAFDGREWPPHPAAWWDQHFTSMVSLDAVTAAWRELRRG